MSADTTTWTLRLAELWVRYNDSRGNAPPRWVSRVARTYASTPHILERMLVERGVVVPSRPAGYLETDR